MDKREHNEKKCQKMVLHERSVGMYDEGSGISVRTTQHINTTTKKRYRYNVARATKNETTNIPNTNQGSR